ncbi:MAG: hypothetical protein ACKO72_04385 [Actinomycetes bacterium]
MIAAVRSADRRIDAWSRGWWGDGPASADAVGRTDAALRVAVFLSLCAAVIQGCVHLADLVLLDRRWEYLDAGGDAGVFMWASAVATFAAAVGLAWCAVLVRRGRRPLLLMAAFVAFLSLDDTVQIHERAGDLVQRLSTTTEIGRLAWPVIYLPLIAALALGLVALTRRAPGRIGRLVALALIAFGIAVLLELASFLILRLGFDYGGWVYETEVAIEEGLELAGWMVIAAALGACSLHLAARTDRRDPD